MIWSLGVKPSDIDIVYWSHSLDDMRHIVGLKAQFELVKVHQEYENLALIVSKAFGGKAEPPKSKAVETWEELTSKFAALGGLVGR